MMHHPWWGSLISFHHLHLLSLLILNPLPIEFLKKLNEVLNLFLNVLPSSIVLFPPKG